MSSLFDLPFDDEKPPRGKTAGPVPEASAKAAALPVRTRPLTVTELTADVRGVLEDAFGEVLVEGELSNCRLWQTGHIYFTLKDANAQVRGVIFRSAVRLLKFKPEDGQRVVVRGRLSVYEVKGEYQLVADTVEPLGFGALQIAFDQLRRRLDAEGLFDPARKRALPLLPRRIGLVTSLDGAAVRDVLSVLGRRYPNAMVVIRPTRVQGEGAAADIARGLRGITRVEHVDVVILCRGGGSIEDLWAFNEEVVARAIVASVVPVISGIGHETDTTIADYAADLRCATPSAAAETVVARKDEFIGRIDRQVERLRASLGRRLMGARSRIHALESRRGLARVPAALAMRGRHVSELGQALRQGLSAPLVRKSRALTALDRGLAQSNPQARLAATRGRLERSDARLAAAIDAGRSSAAAAFRTMAGRLSNLSPLAVLGRGYAVCWDGDRTRIIRRAADVADGDAVRVTLGEGELDCTVIRRTFEE